MGAIGCTGATSAASISTTSTGSATSSAGDVSTSTVSTGLASSMVIIVTSTASLVRRKLAVRHLVLRRIAMRGDAGQVGPFDQHGLAVGAEKKHCGRSVEQAGGRERQAPFDRPARHGGRRQLHRFAGLRGQSCRQATPEAPSRAARAPCLRGFRPEWPGPDRLARVRPIPCRRAARPAAREQRMVRTPRTSPHMPKLIPDLVSGLS